MAFKTIATGAEGQRFKFDKPGVAVEGFYLGTDELEIDGRVVMRHNIETKDGVVQFLGSTDLDQGMAKLIQDDMVRVTYAELKKLKGGKTLKKFRFEVDKDAKRVAATHVRTIA